MRAVLTVLDDDGNVVAENISISPVRQSDGLRSIVYEFQYFFTAVKEDLLQRNS